MEEKSIILDLFNEGVSFTQRVYSQNSHDTIYNEETFRLGISSGVILTADSFILGE